MGKLSDGVFVSQYPTDWLYFELWWCLLQQEVFDSRRKKEKKGRKRIEQERKENEKLEAFQEELDALPKPKLMDLIPIQIIR